MIELFNVVLSMIVFICSSVPMMWFCGLIFAGSIFTLIYRLIRGDYRVVGRHTNFNR